MSAPVACVRGWCRRQCDVERTEEALGPIVKDLGLEEALRLYSIRKSWQKSLGRPLCLHTYPSALNKGQLSINVDTPAWLQQAGYFRAQILQKLGGFGVTDIRLRLGRVDAPHADNKTPAPSRREPDAGMIEQMVSKISDEDLRESIRRAARKGLSTPETDGQA